MKRQAIEAARLLLRSQRPRPGDGEGGTFEESRRATPGGVEYDFYEPKARRGQVFVMLAGLTLLGERDPRLVNFARTFAESGLRVAAPSLPGLKTFRYEVDDLAALTDLVLHLEGVHGGPVGVVAFSAGGGLALVAAAGPALAGRVDPLLLFGPYDSLAELWQRLLSFGEQPPADGEAWDHYLWVQLVLAYRQLDGLDLGEEEGAELLDLLENYCWEPSPARKQAFYEQVLQGRVHVRDEILKGDVLDRLSPRGKLAGLPARVLLLHDSHDAVIPPHHSQRIYEELCARGLPGRQKLLITPLLSHVDARAAWRVLDLFRLVGIVAEIFRPGDGGRA